MMRPLGKPPTPSARSTASEPVVSVSTFILVLLPRRMIEPSPNCLVMAERANSMFLSRACACWPLAAGSTRRGVAALGSLVLTRAGVSGRGGGGGFGNGDGGGGGGFGFLGKSGGG